MDLAVSQNAVLDQIIGSATGSIVQAAREDRGRDIRNANFKVVARVNKRAPLLEQLGKIEATLGRILRKEGMALLLPLIEER